jgi:hypothetical protein
MVVAKSGLVMKKLMGPSVLGPGKSPGAVAGSEASEMFGACRDGGLGAKVDDANRMRLRGSDRRKRW